MSSLTEVQSATVGLMQAGSVALTLKQIPDRTQLQDNVTSGRMVRRGGEASAKKGSRRRKMNMKTNMKKNPCEANFSQKRFSELVWLY